MIKNPVILFRSELDMEDELATARKYLPVVESRMLVPKDSTVISRYSVLPWYQELEKDLNVSGSKLLNSYAQHKWIADLMDWGGPFGVLSDLTPKTYLNWYNIPEGSYVVKGRTNSRKQNWKTHMFAESKKDIPAIAERLLNDSLIQDQGLVVREYVPLWRLGEGLNELPITNEFRSFWIKIGNEVKLLTSGYYWKGSHPETEIASIFSDKGKELAYQAAKRVAEYVSFFVIDVAEKEDGDWIVVEVNDAQMSGLCGCPAEEFYSNLAKYLKV